MSRIADSKRRNASEVAPRSTGKGGAAAEWRGFINVDIGASLRAQCDDWGLTNGPWEQFELAISDGSTISVKQDPHGTGAIASCTQRRADSVNAGYCLTARGGTASKAWLRLMFTLYVVGVETVWTDSGRVSDPDAW